MVRENQAQRMLISDAVKESEKIQQRLVDRIKAYWEERRDPWWDGGKEISKYEGQFTKVKYCEYGPESA